MEGGGQQAPANDAAGFDAPDFPPPAVDPFLAGGRLQAHIEEAIESRPHVDVATPEGVNTMFGVEGPFAVLMRQHVRIAPSEAPTRPEFIGVEQQGGQAAARGAGRERPDVRPPSARQDRPR